MMAAANIASTGIVLEGLRKDNYENWSTLVKNYLVGKRLWHGIVEADSNKLESEKDDDWRSKNAKALHAIQLACGSENLSSIRKFEKAKEAWNHLKVSFSEEVPDPYVELRHSQAQHVFKLHSAVKRGYWNDAKSYINRNPDSIFSTTPSMGRTILHVAVAYGEDGIVKELVNMGNQRFLRMQDKRGYTALALAAELTDNKDMAKWMIDKGGKELLTIETEDDYEIPVLLAAAKGHRRMTMYLFSHTPIDVFLKRNGYNGVMLLTRCVSARIFDFAALLLQYRRDREAPFLQINYDLRPIHALSHMPSAFRSGTKLGRWQKFIYNSLRLPTHIELELYDQPKPIEIVLHDEADKNTPAFATHPFHRFFRLVPIKNLLSCFGRLFGQFEHVQTSMLRRLPGSEQIYEMKRNHYLALEILKWLSLRMSELYESQLREYSTYGTMLQAVKYGITEFIDLMIRANPDLLWVTDKHNRDIFAHAILNRQEKVFRLLLENQGRKEMVASREDVFGNNLLHLAAELGPSSYLSNISNSALQMQRELQWFKAVERIVPQNCKEAKNNDGVTPWELFTKNHAELVKDSEKWARDTASSFTLVGTLIITIMFAAAFTVPGGNDQNTGIPIFLRRRAFIVFIVADTISLIMSSSSVLVFIGILTSRYAEKDFLKSLHYKILLGLFTLFFSVASMMVAFVAALSMMMKGYRGVVITTMSFAVVPVCVLLLTHWSLTFEILRSTWIPNMLTTKKKKSQG